MAGDITTLLRRMRTGDQEAADSLVPLVLGELRNLAAHYLRGERDNHTLQPTALINELYLRLVKMNDVDWQSRAHFIGMAATLMRQVLIDYSRKAKASKRAMIGQPVHFLGGEDVPASNGMSPELLLALDQALDSLEKMSPRQGRIVEMRYFGGLSIEETAEVLCLSPITIKREWLAARVWLKLQLQPQDAC